MKFVKGVDRGILSNYKIEGIRYELEIMKFIKLCG